MKSLSSSLIAIALLATILPAQAQQRNYREGAAPAPKALGDPLQRLYRVSGVRDNGAAPERGVATTFHCTSASTVDETIRIRVRDFNGNQAGTRATTIEPMHTVTMSTHLTRLFVEDSTLSPGTNINQGSADILGTSVNIFCSAMIVDAVSNFPLSTALHMVRYHPIPGTQE